MKLIGVNGVIAKARRFLSASGSIDNPESATPEQTARSFRQLAGRLAELEARVGPAAVDFEVHVGTAGAVTTILHGFSSPVRWWVVCWTQVGGYSYPTAPPVLVEDATSTSDKLALRSYQKGRAIVRVEPAGSGIEPGITLGAATAPYSHLAPLVSGLRLTLTTATPVTRVDVTGASTIYLTPYISGQIRLYYNGEWTTRETTEVSLAIGTLAATSVYDVFAYWTGSAVAIELSAAWASATSRTDALAMVNGILTKSSDSTRVYVGTFRTVTSTTMEDSKAKRFVWNMHNRVRREMYVTTTGSQAWVNPNGAFRRAKNAATSIVEYVCGEASQLNARSTVGCSTTAASGFASGISIDSATVNSATTFGNWTAAAGAVAKAEADYVGCPVAGYHEISWLESGQSGALTYTFQFSGVTWQSGLSCDIMG